MWRSRERGGHGRHLRQREADFRLYREVIRPRHEQEIALGHRALAGPNLLVETQPLGSDDRAVFPALMLKLG